jgi:DNA-binding CsgD family transcriptional regulator
MMYADPKDLTFEARLEDIKRIGDELPTALIVRRVADLSLVYMNKAGYTALGISYDELQKLNPSEYHGRFYDQEERDEYVPKIMELIIARSSDDLSFFQHLKNQQTGEWNLFLTNTRVFHQNAKGEPTHIIIVAGRIDPLHKITGKVSRLMDELSFFKKHNRLFQTLTKREIDVLRLVALGKSAPEISEALFISPTTVETHRKNIRNKLGIKNPYDTLLFAQAYDLI